MECFFAHPNSIARNFLVIDGEEFSHLTHVMRRKIGDELRVVDGEGSAYDAIITAIKSRSARCEIRATYSRLNEAETDIALAVGLLKNASKFDFIAEKATELGVMSIVPLLTERTIPRHAKVERWQKLALAAMKQSCRCMLPQVHQPETFKEFISSAKMSALRIIPHESAEQPLHDLLSAYATEKPRRTVVICIGPEGGFSDTEIGLATEAGFAPVNMGPRRLRSETAAIVSTASLALMSG